MSNEKPVRLELTEEQKAQVKAATGKDARAIELNVEELEQRIAPGKVTPHVISVAVDGAIRPAATSSARRGARSAVTPWCDRARARVYCGIFDPSAPARAVAPRRHRCRPIRLRQPGIRRGPRPRDRSVPVARARPPAAARGRGRRRQDRGRPDAGGRPRRGAHPAPMLRGAGRQHRGLRVGLSSADAGDPPARGPRRGQVGRHARHLRRGVPPPAAAAQGARVAGGRAAGPADRRGGSRGRRVRGVPARAPQRLRGHHSGDRHHPGRAAAAGHPHEQPHARGARRAQAPVPLPLDRLPLGHARAGDPPRPVAARPRRHWLARWWRSCSGSARRT